MAKAVPLYRHRGPSIPGSPAYSPLCSGAVSSAPPQSQGCKRTIGGKSCFLPSSPAPLKPCLPHPEHHQHIVTGSESRLHSILTAEVWGFGVWPTVFAHELQVVAFASIAEAEENLAVSCQWRLGIENATGFKFNHNNNNNTNGVVNRHRQEQEQHATGNRQQMHRPSKSWEMIQFITLWQIQIFVFVYNIAGSCLPHNALSIGKIAYIIQTLCRLTVPSLACAVSLRQPSIQLQPKPTACVQGAPSIRDNMIPPTRKITPLSGLLRAILDRDPTDKT
ncbi:hypothetical protein CPLU01_04255 [Colletotrichum plurivorum]|uniref:Uncharacterized protein n=1 Tax=Colletotrichum plurivorum TaxID=2175906 RepID=A0A8H6NJE3_9PEZI|nr:hypothetical protein CPLU01_04255 [Colletotrichum plurivorum]